MASATTTLTLAEIQAIFSVTFPETTARAEKLLATLDVTRQNLQAEVQDIEAKVTALRTDLAQRKETNATIQKTLGRIEESVSQSVTSLTELVSDIHQLRVPALPA